MMDHLVVELDQLVKGGGLVDQVVDIVGSVSDIVVGVVVTVEVPVVDWLMQYQPWKSETGSPIEFPV